MAKKYLNPIVAATVVVILYSVMPILSVFISAYITTYAYMLLVVSLLAFILLTGGIERLSFIVNLILPAILYIVCTFFIKTDSLTIWGYKSMLFIMPVIIGYYYIDYKPECLSLFSKALMLALVITAVTTVIGLIRFPEASRILATIATSDDEENIRFSWNNIGGYDFIYTCVLLYPMLILAYKLGRINRIVFFAAFLLLLTLVILSEYTTALLLFLISTILFFAGKRLNESQLLIFGIVAFWVVLLFWDFFSQFLIWLADLFKSDILTERLTALANGITGLENSESNRIELYRMSLNAFWSSPFFGRIFGSKMLGGGHSFILDSLADYGILGGITIVLTYRNVYRRFFKPYSMFPCYGYVLWAFFQAMILSTVNTGMWLGVLALFIPSLLYLIYKQDSEEIYENTMDS
ncbi:MAG: hypothetical protein IK086_04155 [Clostridia bacterium]|nr:hypothetical protein [Clostridia bacterium]